MDKERIIGLATQMIKSKVPSEFSDSSKNSEALRKLFVEANGGKTELRLKDLYRGNPVFDIIEELIPVMIEEGLKGDEFFFDLVEYHNVALGDDIDFQVEDHTELIVADGTYGTDGIRRQRLGGLQHVTIPTQLKVVKVYDEFKRFLAGKIDFNELVSKVSSAMIKQLRNDIFTVFNGISNSNQYGLGDTYVPVTGTYSEDKLLELCEHVEAANNGSPITIVGVKSALRKCTTAVQSDEAKTDMYNMGYYGKFNGVKMVYVPQVHKAGTSEFLLPDKKLFVIPAGVKPIKVLNMGEGYAATDNPLENGDHTQNYFYGQEFGVGLIFSSKIGVYTLS